MNLLFKSVANYSNTGRPNQLDYHGYHTIAGNDSGAAVDPTGGGNLYGPVCIYSNGRTYFTFKRNQNSSDGKPVVGQLYNGAVTYSTITDTYTDNADYHNHPTLQIDSSGYIWVFHEQHGDAPHVYKSNNPHDITAFTKMYNGSADGPMDYGKTIIMPSGTFIQLGRIVGYDFGVRTSANGSTWGAISDVTNVVTEGGSSDYRHYPHLPINYMLPDGRICIVLFKRVVISSVIRYIRCWVLCTSDGITFSNYQNTYSKNIVSGGFISETLLNSNCLVWADLSFTEGLYSIVKDGTLYTQKGTTVYYWTGSAWSSFTGTAMLGACPIDDDAVIVGSAAVTTHDLQSTKYSTPIYVPDTSYLLTGPFNMDDIPSGQEFGYLRSTLKDGDTDVINGTTKNDLVVYRFRKP